MDLQGTHIRGIGPGTRATCGKRIWQITIWLLLLVLVVAPVVAAPLGDGDTADSDLEKGGCSS